MRSAIPIRRKISIVRALQRSIFGRNSGAAFFSTSMQRTPRRPRSIARVRPTGPAPTTSTSVTMSGTGERPFEWPDVVRPAGAAAPVFPRSLVGERGARPEHGVDLAVAEERDRAEGARFELKVGVELEINRIENGLAQRGADNDAPVASMHSGARARDKTKRSVRCGWRMLT